VVIAAAIDDVGPDAQVQAERQKHIVSKVQTPHPNPPTDSSARQPCLCIARGRVEPSPCNPNPALPQRLSQIVHLIEDEQAASSFQSKEHEAWHDDAEDPRSVIFTTEHHMAAYQQVRARSEYETLAAYQQVPRVWDRVSYRRVPSPGPSTPLSGDEVSARKRSGGMRCTHRRPVPPVSSLNLSH
jgi:hypothetical protein